MLMQSGSAGIRLRPVSYAVDPLAVHSQFPQRYPFLLESTAAGTAQGRYDILFAFPGQQVLSSSGSPGFLAAFDREWREARRDTACQLPFSGGWFCLLSYELAAEVEPSLDLPEVSGSPRAIATRIPVALIRDHLTQAAWVVNEAGFEAEADEAVKDVERAQRSPVRNKYTGESLVNELVEPPPAEYLAAVQSAQTQIAEGNLYQANLSRVWRGGLTRDACPQVIYSRLRETNPGPFAGLAMLPNGAVISSSPERLVRVSSGSVATRPIAGTYPRGSDGIDDEPQRDALLRHPKERAEHIMLIDLERNDLGRICKAGSVAVDEFMVVESYSHVHHIVSNVVGHLRGDVTPGDVLQAVFPGGTITGCPKVRCMQLIADLERRPRGFYTGAMGYVNHTGDADFNILIRTMTVQGDEISLAAGSGVVADSSPERELNETRAKAKGMLLALQ